MIQLSVGIVTDVYKIPFVVLAYTRMNGQVQTFFSYCWFFFFLNIYLKINSHYNYNIW